MASLEPIGSRKNNKLHDLYGDSSLPGTVNHDGTPSGGAPRLPIDVVRRLSKPNVLVSLGVILRDWSIIVAAIWLCERHWHPALYLLAVVVIASRVSSLGGLVHEAAHYNLAKNKRLNDWLAHLFSVWLLLGSVSLKAYRTSHLTHHKYANTRRDPDPPLLGMKNIEGVGDVLRFFGGGLVFPVVYFVKFFWARPLLQKVIAIAALSLFAYALPALALKLLLYWIIPLLTVYSLFVFIRLNAEHNAVESDHELYRSRTVHATLFDRLTVAPQYVGYHLAHHVYPSVPFFRRKELDEALMAESTEYRANAHVTRGYHRLLVELVTYRGGPLVRE
jgi:fatty acid desaturase